MAIPRVFVSSTFYDLRQIRADLELFIKEMGYEPILHERGAVSYGSTEKLEEYAYREVETVDILVSIVGSRFGTASQHESRSISQEELKRALDRRIQVHIFVEQAVLVEYQTYKANKDVKGVVWRYVDDVRVYDYLEQMYALPNNNTIQGFETAADITEFLKRQWAGLFQRFLADQARAREINTLEELQSTAATLDRVVQFLAEARQDQADAIAGILNTHHPLFTRLRTLLNVKYPIFFRTINELNRWLVDAQRFSQVPRTAWDDRQHREWHRGNKYLRVGLALFDNEGRLLPAKDDQLKDDDVEFLPIPVELEEDPDSEAAEPPRTQRRRQSSGSSPE